jgi:hypothetical protein
VLLLAVPPFTPPLARDRQRGMIDSLETELAEKLQQLQLLTAENEMLRLRESVLEAAVASRAEVVRYACSAGAYANHGCAVLLQVGRACRQLLHVFCIVCCVLTMPLLIDQRQTGVHVMPNMSAGACDAGSWATCA